MANVTANYGWVKPVVGGDGDAWGDEINTDLDGIDSTVKGVSNAIPAASSTPPIMDGTATVGTGATFARADHVHPSDTTKYAASNPSGYQTAAQVTAAVPVASSTTPAMDGAAVVGTGTTWARADHVHPTDTTLAPLASPAFTGSPSMPTGTTGVTQTAGDSSTRLATTAFVSAMPVAMGDNRLINGDMRIDQRNGGASGTLSGYTVDRWAFNAASTVGAWGRNGGGSGLAGPVGFPYSLGFVSSSAYVSAAADYFQFNQPVEADMVSDFAWGTPQAQPVTLSFWAQSSKTGTFGGAIVNYAGTRSYPFGFSIPAANTWTKIVLTIPGDTGGTWVMSGNTGAMQIIFDFGGGSSRRGPAGVWASTSYSTVTGAVSIVATNGANFYLTGVKLEVGSVATPYNHQSLAKSMMDCQRYYQTFYVSAGGYATTGTVFQSPFRLPLMRAAPTLNAVNNGSANIGTIVCTAASADSGNVTSGSIPTTGQTYLAVIIIANAEL